MAAAPCQSMPLPTQQLPAKMISSMPHQTIQQSLEKSLNQNAPPENCDGQSLVGLLQERILNYKSAQENAKAAGESAKVRRLDRGLKVQKKKHREIGRLKFI